MPGYSNEGKAVMLEALRQNITHLSIHDGDPGAGGANEVSGNGYSRKSVSGSDFTAPSSGEIETTADHEFDGPAANGATYFGIWDGSDFLGGGQIVSGDTAFNAEGKYRLNAGTTADLNV